MGETIAVKTCAAFVFTLLIAITALGQENSQKQPDTIRLPQGVEVLSDTQGVDFAPYLEKVCESVRLSWLRMMPAEARAPELKSGNVETRFAILQNGHVVGVEVTKPSGDAAMDRAAAGAIVSAAPFHKLPKEFKGSQLALKFDFYHNLPKPVSQTTKSDQK